MNTIVLGAGLVGGPMALDLAQDQTLQVTVADINEQALQDLSKQNPELKTEVADLSQPAKVKELIKDFDIVLNAVPGFIPLELDL